MHVAFVTAHLHYEVQKQLSQATAENERLRAALAGLRVVANVAIDRLDAYQVIGEIKPHEVPGLIGPLCEAVRTADAALGEST